MKYLIKLIANFLLFIFLFIFLTVLTQIGGLVFVFAICLAKYLPALKHSKLKYKRTLVYIISYLLMTFIIVPLIAPIISGREPVKHYDNLKPATYMTVLLNRHYVRPELNDLLTNTAESISHTDIQVNYLDANFPFIDGFPLIPHLSHKDGKKIDLSYVYENPDGTISSKQKSVSGFGIFIEPTANELNTAKRCMAKNPLYNYPAYLSFGKINRDLQFSKSGSKQLVKALLNNQNIGKVFIEPHLVQRMGLRQGGNSKIRFQGCHSVRHDDHMHIQLR